eukprot:5376512-Amphidinium_carterae.1
MDGMADSAAGVGGINVLTFEWKYGVQGKQKLGTNPLRTNFSDLSKNQKCCQFSSLDSHLPTPDDSQSR